MKRDHDRHLILKRCTNALRYLGLWKISSKSSTIRLHFYSLYKCFVLVMIFGFFVALATDLIQSTDDLLVMTDDGCILAGLSVILFKLISFQIHTKKLQNLLDFVDVNVKIINDDENLEYVKIWRYYVLREKVTLYGFGTIGMCLIVALMFFAPTENGALPIRSLYPFDVTKTPIHQIMFVYQGTVLTISMVSILAMDNIVLALCSQIFCHFEILKKNFSRCSAVGEEVRNDRENRRNVNDLWLSFNDEESEVKKRNDNKFSADEKSKSLQNICFVKNFSNCIKRHQEIIKFVQHLDEFFSPLMFVQLMASNVIICLTGFQTILVVGQHSSFMKFAVYLSAAFSQLFYWCWCGNELMYQSTSIAEVIRLCRWEVGLMSKIKIASIKSLITIPLIRIKKPLKLTAGKFYIMSMETFMSVLSGSYSFFTLLNKMNDNDSDKTGK